MNSEIITLLKILAHTKQVSGMLRNLARQLDERADQHDLSKFELDEFEGFVQAEINRGHQKEEYGSKGYEKSLKSIDGIRWHLSRNRHHPEHWPNGIEDMNLVDILEMLFDWEAARQARDTETNIEVTWQTRQKRFNLIDKQIEFLRETWYRLQK